MKSNNFLPQDMGGRFYALDGLRGCAVLAVIFYHSILMFMDGNRVSILLKTSFPNLFGYEKYARLVLTIFNGELAVFLFFAMSAGVLIQSLEKESRKYGYKNALMFFPLKRFFRIYPALIVCLAMLYLVYNFLHFLSPDQCHPTELKRVLINMTLYDITVHGASWTLQIEVIATGLIIFHFILREKLGFLSSIGMVLYYILYKVTACTWVLYFSAGFLAYDLAKFSFIQKIMSGWKWVFFLSILIFVKTFNGLGSKITHWTQLLSIVVMFSYIFGGNTNSLTRFLSKKWPVYFGKISYSLYLWNVILLNVFFHAMRALEWTKTYYVEAGIFVGIFVILLSVPISSFSEKYIEQYFMSFFNTYVRKFFNKERKPSCVVSNISRDNSFELPIPQFKAHSKTSNK